MKGIITIIIINFLISCSGNSVFNKSIANKNMSLVINTRNFESMFIYDKSSKVEERATLLKINGLEVSKNVKSHNIPNGKNTLLVFCLTPHARPPIYGLPVYVFNEFILNVNLEKGHTYELIPMYINDLKTSVKSCSVKLNDITTI